MRNFFLWQKPLLLFALAFSAVLFIVLSQQVNADMFGWLKKTELELSPEVKGTVTLHGKPVAGAKIIRTLTYSDKKFNDNTTTDEQGHFQFPVKTVRLRTSSMFDTWISQVLTVEHENHKIKIWSAGATNTLTYDSIRKLLSHIQCELTSPEMKIGVSRENPQSPPLWLVSICSFEYDNIIIEKELNK